MLKIINLCIQRKNKHFMLLTYLVFSGALVVLNITLGSDSEF